MEQQLKEFLQLSAKLYEKLTNVPDEPDRDEFITEIDSLLDQRGVSIQQLTALGFVFDDTQKIHQTLLELDKGIRERLNVVLQSIKLDMKELQSIKKSEQQYTNPYGHVQMMDGMYYDKKK